MIYFAYGSNMDPEQMRQRCPQHKVLGPAHLRGYTLCFPRRSPVRSCGTAGLSRAVGEGVWGVLYELSEADLARLHAAEGYLPGRAPEENRHELAEVEVTRGGGVVQACTYFARPDESAAAPSRAYLDHLLRGAEAHGLPKVYQAKLRSIDLAEAG